MVRLNPDVFIANNGGYPAGDYCRSATIAASLRSGIKVVHVVHNMAVASPWFRVGFEWFIDRLIDSRSTLVAVSERAAKQLNKVRWIKQNPIVVYNGVEMRPKKMAGKKGKVFTILNVGYFGLVKNQKLLIDVFASLVIKGHSEIRLTFIGAETEEGYQEECRKMVAELGVEKLVNFLGFMEEPEVWYQEADVFVLCSIIEGFPMTVLEAMRASTPVIATDVGGVGEQVSDGETGFIIREGDRKSLAEVLEIVISDENLCRRLGESGRKRFEERYTVETMISQYAKLLGLSGQNVISK
jgi:glycosyltransferase involved in cell wall biosynthesis